MPYNKLFRPNPKLQKIIMKKIVKTENKSVYQSDRHMRSNHERFRVLLLSALQRNHSADNSAYFEVGALGDFGEEKAEVDGEQHTTIIEDDDDDTVLQVVEVSDVLEGDQAQHDPLENSSNENVYRPNFFPFSNEIHRLLHEFYYRIGADISQAQMWGISGKFLFCVTSLLCDWKGWAVQ